MLNVFFFNNCEINTKKNRLICKYINLFMKIFKSLFAISFLFLLSFNLNAQYNPKQKGLLWEITGNGLKKPSYVYGTMHISRKLAFHLGDSFYLSLLKCDVVALEQSLDSVIHRWISEDEEEKPEDKDKVYSRSTNSYLNLTDFMVNSFDKELIERKLSAEVREVNYLLKRGSDNDFEEDAWLDLYIYQLGKKTGKALTGVEGYEESRLLVDKSRKEPEDSKEKNKKLKYYSYKMREQVAEAYRKGNLYMIDSIDRLTESEHFREYMLYKRNANMVRRMDSIMQLGKALFTGVGCAHLPNQKGVLQMLVDKGYKIRPVQSIANEKSKLAQKYEDMKYKHEYTSTVSEDGVITANLPMRLTKVRNYSSYSSYLCPDLANGYYYQIEKISCNSAFSDKSQNDILLDIDTMIFENIPGEIKSKKEIKSNGFPGFDIVTELKTGDLNRFQILVSPFNVYIVRMSAKDKFATGSESDNFFKSLKINEKVASTWHNVSSEDSVFSIQLPIDKKVTKLEQRSKIDPSFEHVVFDNNSGTTYLIKQEDLLNDNYLEEDTFELSVMAQSFSKTDNYKIKSKKNHVIQGYNASDVVFETKNNEKMYGRFVICGTRYILFLSKPKKSGSFDDEFFKSIKFNGKPNYQYFEYKDTNSYFKVKTPVKPLLVKQNKYEYGFYYDYDGESEEDDKPSKYKEERESMYFKLPNSNDLIEVYTYKKPYYSWEANSNSKYNDSTELNYKVRKYRKVKNNSEYVNYIISDTNTNRQVRIMRVNKGLFNYNVIAFVDTVSGNPIAVNEFMNSFDVSDTMVPDYDSLNSSQRFFKEFASNDSIKRKQSIKHFYNVNFTKKDIKDMMNVIDTVSNKSKGAKIRSGMISRLGYIDSMDNVIVPYLHKLYKRFEDTAYLQIQILQALASQKSDVSYKSIKQIISTDIPISDQNYEMENLFDYFDTLKLTKTLLPELIELSSLQDFRESAYATLAKMKDSSIITLADYSSIHNRLITEARVAYKKKIASVIKEEDEYSSYGGYRSYGRYSYYNYGDYEYEASEYSDDFATLMKLSLPLRTTNATMQNLVDKILKITDNDLRLKILPALLKEKIHFHDTVYETLAKEFKTRSRFYKILEKANSLDKFPKKYKSQNEMIMAEIKKNSSEYNVIDTVIKVGEKVIKQGKNSYRMHIYKYKYEDDDEFTLYFSASMPLDTNKLNSYKDDLAFYSKTYNVTEKRKEEDIISDHLFKLHMSYVRKRNGGYSHDYYSYSNFGDYDFYDEY